MDAGDLTHSEKLALAEVSAALNTISSQWYESQKGYHDAGVLPVTDMATSVGAMYLAQQQILERFAAQARNKGDTDLADILDSWATAYAAKEQSIKTDIQAGKAEDVVWGVIGETGVRVHFPTKRRGMARQIAGGCAGKLALCTHGSHHAPPATTRPRPYPSAHRPARQ